MTIKANPVNLYANDAYLKVLNASKTMKPQEAMQVAQEQMNILRVGDNIEVKSQPQTFPEVLTDIVVNKANTIKKPENFVKQAFQPNSDGQVLGADNVQILQALNEADSTLMLVQAARNNVVNALHDILKMPL